MSRIRNVKPEFFRHEQLQELEAKHPGLFPMLTFAGLWTASSKNGVFPWKPRNLHLDILPFLTFDMGETLSILVIAGFVKRFEVDGKQYGFIPTLREHQTISGQESKQASKYPDYVPNTDWEVRGKVEGSDREVREKADLGLRTLDLGHRTEELPPAPETPKTEPKPVPAVDKYDDTQGPHFACVARWFRAMTTATGIPILPDERDFLAGRELLASLGGDTATLDRLTDYYFANWRGIWWARDKTTGKPDFSFRSFKAHATELIGKISEPKRNEPKSWSTASAPVADEEIITPEQMAAVKSKLRGKGLPLIVAGGQA